MAKGDRGGRGRSAAKNARGSNRSGRRGGDRGRSNAHQSGQRNNVKGSFSGQRGIGTSGGVGEGSAASAGYTSSGGYSSSSRAFASAQYSSFADQQAAQAQAVAAAKESKRQGDISTLAKKGEFTNPSVFNQKSFDKGHLSGFKAETTEQAIGDAVSVVSKTAGSFLQSAAKQFNEATDSAPANESESFGRKVGRTESAALDIGGTGLTGIGADIAASLGGPVVSAVKSIAEFGRRQNVINSLDGTDAKSEQLAQAGVAPVSNVRSEGGGQQQEVATQAPSASKAASDQSLDIDETPQARKIKSKKTNTGISLGNVGGRESSFIGAAAVKRVKSASKRGRT